MSSTVAFPDFSDGSEASSRALFRCTVETSDSGPTWVRVAGELDIRTAPELEAMLRRTHGVSRMAILDLRELSFLDSSGVHVIIDASKRARRAHRDLVVIQGSSQVELMLTMSGAAEVLNLVDLNPAEPFPRRSPPDQAA